MTLSVTDDWDLQRRRSAPVPVRLPGRACRIIKGLQNTVTQQPWFQRTTAHNPTASDTAYASTLTGVILLLPRWCILPADQEESLLFDIKCPWCHQKKKIFWDERTHGSLYHVNRSRQHSHLAVIYRNCVRITQHTINRMNHVMFMSSVGILQWKNSLSGIGCIPAWPLITNKVITRQRQWKLE